MADSTLCVRAVGDKLVVNYEALEAGARRYIGRTFLPSVGPQGGWPAARDAVTVPVREEYLKPLRDGALAAADQATAERAGVAFDAQAEATAAANAKEFWAKAEPVTQVEPKSAVVELKSSKKES